MSAPVRREAPRPLMSYPPYWAHSFGIAPVLPMSRAEMDDLGWDGCDIILVTGDAYIDHPSFGMALIGRLLEAHGFRVGIIAQPDWRSAEPFAALGRPALMFGVTAGNMDSMVNRYTSDRKIRSDDAYTPDAEGGKRPDRSVIVYAQRCREAFADAPIVIGGIEASLRRIAHYDYWSDKVRRSVLLDAKADLLVYGNAERAIVEIAHRLAAGASIGDIRGVRGTVYATRTRGPGNNDGDDGDDGWPGGERGGKRDGWRDGWIELDSTEIEPPRPNPPPPPSPYAEPIAGDGAACAADANDAAGATNATVALIPLRRRAPPRADWHRTVIRMPSFEQVSRDPALYAHASRILHLESNPGNARALVQRHGDRDVWLEPPPIPLTTPEMDAIYELPYSRVPHPSYGDARIPAYEMIRFSVTILRGCFGGCTFCSITEHEGRIIQNRSEDSVIREIERVRDATPGFTGVISDVGGPTANMYRLACKSRDIEAACRKPSCVYPDICGNLNTDHAPLVRLYRRARAVPGVNKVLVASGLRYDLAVRSPEYVAELAAHHVGGYLKIAPEHTEDGPLSMMMKPGIGAYDRFKAMFDRASERAGKRQYLIPYFIAAHPGTTDEDMLALAVWLKQNGFRADQVQAFLPSPMATATAMYHTGFNPLRSLRRGDRVAIPKRARTRRLHKALLRYHDPDNWPLLRAALRRMGRGDLIGNGPQHLIPHGQPADRAKRAKRPERRAGPGQALTQHTGLPPQPSSGKGHKRRKRRRRREPEPS